MHRPNRATAQPTEHKRTPCLRRKLMGCENLLRSPLPLHRVALLPAPPRLHPLRLALWSLLLPFLNSKRAALPSADNFIELLSARFILLLVRFKSDEIDTGQWLGNCQCRSNHQGPNFWFSSSDQTWSVENGQICIFWLVPRMTISPLTPPHLSLTNIPPFLPLLWKMEETKFGFSFLTGLYIFAYTLKCLIYIKTNCVIFPLSVSLLSPLSIISSIRTIQVDLFTSSNSSTIYSVIHYPVYLFCIYPPNFID